MLIYVTYGWRCIYIAISIPGIVDELVGSGLSECFIGASFHVCVMKFMGFGEFISMAFSIARLNANRVFVELFLLSGPCGFPELSTNEGRYGRGAFARREIATTSHCHHPAPIACHRGWLLYTQCEHESQSETND